MTDKTVQLTSKDGVSTATLRDWVRDCDLLIESGVTTDSIAVCPIALRRIVRELLERRARETPQPASKDIVERIIRTVKTWPVESPPTGTYQNWIATLVAEIEQLRAELAKWQANCTGKHGSQASCVDSPPSETPVDPLDAWALKADNDRLRGALNSALNVLQGVLGPGFRVEPLPQDRPAQETNAEPSLLNITRGQLDFTTAVTGNAHMSGLTKAQFLHMVTLAWDARDAVKADERELSASEAASFDRALRSPRRVDEKASESHYCIDCNEAHDPRTCGALGPEKNGNLSHE